MPKRDKDKYNAYMRAYMMRRYQERRTRALGIFGGKCAICGSTDDLQIDHTNRGDKIYDLGKLLSSAPWSRIARELKSCQALCRTCHQLKTVKELSNEHGGGLTGRRNCYCDLCKPLKAEYNRRRKVRIALQEAMDEHGAVE